MKTRRQRQVEQQAGHPPSPPQSLPMNQPGPRRARSKTPRATITARPVAPATQSAALGEPQALIRVWVDLGPELSGQPVNEPIHQVAFDSSLLPKMFQFLSKIRNQSDESTTLHQETPEREVREAMEPREPEPVTPGKSNKTRKKVFQRNPMNRLSGLEWQPVPASIDLAAVDPIIFRSDFNFAANTPRGEISQQPDEKLHAHENSHMVDHSKSGSTIGPSVETIQQANTQQGALTPDTPRRSKWGLGGFLESARAITRRLGFSPLALISEIPEASAQMASMNAPPTVTISAAPAQPRKKSSAPTSASSRRTKSRRHDESAGKSGSTSRRNDRPRAKRAQSAEDERFPTLESTDPENDGEEARKVLLGVPAETIRWPSRSLERMNAKKRKCLGDPSDTPGAETGGQVRGATDTHEGCDERSSTEEQPVKRRRTEQSRGLANQVTGSVPWPPAC